MLFDKFTDTVFLKETSDLKDKLEALEILKRKYPDNKDIEEEYYIVKKGVTGEDEISYQLKKSNLGLYVLRDINIEYEDLTAQIDYIVITKAYNYFIECKNLIGNIKVNNSGDFIRELFIDGKKSTKGMYSPLRQVEAQRDVYQKIWKKRHSKNVIERFWYLSGEDNFDEYNRVLVVAANHETILDTRFAPKNIKDKVLKADSLVRKLEEDLSKSDKSIWDSKKEMEQRATNILNHNVEKNIDYYEFYKNKFNLDDSSKYFYYTSRDDSELRKDLVKFRKLRSSEMNIPAYYVFTNDELDKLIKEKPKNMNELKGILSDVKINTHGKEIIKEINK